MLSDLPSACAARDVQGFRRLTLAMFFVAHGDGRIGEIGRQSQRFTRSPFHIGFAEASNEPYGFDSGGRSSTVCSRVITPVSGCISGVMRYVSWRVT